MNEQKPKEGKSSGSGESLPRKPQYLLPVDGTGRLVERLKGQEPFLYPDEAAKACIENILRSKAQRDLFSGVSFLARIRTGDVIMDEKGRKERAQGETDVYSVSFKQLEEQLLQLGYRPASVGEFLRYIGYVNREALQRSEGGSRAYVCSYPLEGYEEPLGSVERLLREELLREQEEKAPDERIEELLEQIHELEHLRKGPRYLLAIWDSAKLKWFLSLVSESTAESAGRYMGKTAFIGVPLPPPEEEKGKKKKKRKGS